MKLTVIIYFAHQNAAPESSGEEHVWCGPPGNLAALPNGGNMRIVPHKSGLRFNHLVVRAYAPSYSPGTPTSM
jgi:hypothetical protein